MHNMIGLLILVVSGSVPLWSKDFPVSFKSDDCGGVEVVKSAVCEVSSGDTCTNQCESQDFQDTCVSECGLQNCHDYDCWEWRCVADCTSDHVQGCINGCSAGGAVFCDQSYLVSGSEVDTCVDFLCSHDVEVQGDYCK